MLLMVLKSDRKIKNFHVNDIFSDSLDRNAYKKIVTEAAFILAKNFIVNSHCTVVYISLFIATVTAA